MFSMNTAYKIITHLQFGLEIAFFSKYEHFKCIALIKISLWCAVFVGLQLPVYK